MYADGKITFREFSHGITPEYPGAIAINNNNEGNTIANPEFNIEQK